MSSSLSDHFVSAALEAFAGFYTLADLRDYLSKYEEAVGAEVVDAAVEIAPKYAERLILWHRQRSLNLTSQPELDTLEDNLNTFNRVKKIDVFKEEAPEELGYYLRGADPADINSYKSYADFATAMITFEDVKSKAETHREKIREGYNKVAEVEGGWALYELTNAEATMALCEDTDWCVASPDSAEHYLEHGQPLHLITQNNEPAYLISLYRDEMQDIARNDVTWAELSEGAREVLDKTGLGRSVRETFGDAERLREQSQNATYRELLQDYAHLAVQQMGWHGDILARLEESPYYLTYNEETGDAAHLDRSQVLEVMDEQGHLNEKEVWYIADGETVGTIGRMAKEPAAQLPAWMTGPGPLVREDVPEDFARQIFNWLLQNHPEQVRADSVLEAANDGGVIPDREYLARAALATGFGSPQAMQMYNLYFQEEREEQPTGPGYQEQPGYDPEEPYWFSKYEEQLPFGLEAILTTAMMRFGQIAMDYFMVWAQKKREYLIKSYVGREVKQPVTEEAVDAALDLDVKNAEWLVQQHAKGNFNLTGPDPDEGFSGKHVKDLLERFRRVRQLSEFKESGNSSDPAKYDRILDMFDVVHHFENILRTKEYERKQVQEGHQLLAENEDFAVYQITNVEASGALCAGTEWCVRKPDWAGKYLKLGPLYMVADKESKKPTVLISLDAPNPAIAMGEWEDDQLADIGIDVDNLPDALKGEVRNANNTWADPDGLDLEIDELLAEVGILDRLQDIEDPDILEDEIKEKIAEAGGGSQQRYEESKDATYLALQNIYSDYATRDVEWPTVLDRLDAWMDLESEYWEAEGQAANVNRNRVGDKVVQILQEHNWYDMDNMFDQARGQTVEMMERDHSNLVVDTEPNWSWDVMQWFVEQDRYEEVEGSGLLHGVGTVVDQTSMVEALASLGYLRPELYAEWAGWLESRGIEYEPPEEYQQTAQLALAMLRGEYVA